MTADSRRPPPYPGDREDASSYGSPNHSSVDTLRDILLGHDRQRIAELGAELDELERRITEEEALIDMLAPVLDDVIRRKIRDEREEMVEALYPIIGQTVRRAISKAIRNRAHAIAVWIRTSLSPGALWRRLRARVRGIFGAEPVLQGSSPCEVAEVFLIHRDTGLLLWHVSSTPRVSRDPHVIREMLATIHEFAQDAFGQGEEGQREAAGTGEQRILMEAAQHTYLAVVIEGVEPAGFRAEMHKRITEVEQAYQRALRRSDSDPPRRLRVREPLNSLMAAARR